ncbi:MAG: hypothetical protein AB7O61_24830 [Acidimicrobiia bacterium]
MSHDDYLKAVESNYRSAMHALRLHGMRNAEVISTGGGCLAISGLLSEDPLGPHWMLTIEDPLPESRIPDPGDTTSDFFNRWRLGMYRDADDALAAEGMIVVLDQDYRRPEQDGQMAIAVAKHLDIWCERHADAFTANMISLREGPPTGENRFNPAALEAARDAFWRAIAKGHPWVTSGDFSPEATAEFEAATELAMRRWVIGNLPYDETEEAIV